jgi:hypothetical protein
MEITLTEFRRQFSKARRAADLGEVVEIRAADNRKYFFARRPKNLTNPFFAMEHLFGVVGLNRKNGPLRDRIRRRIQKNTLG